MDHLGLRGLCIGEPLDKMGAAFLKKKHTADQIDCAEVSGKAGGLNIKEQERSGIPRRARG